MRPVTSFPLCAHVKDLLSRLLLAAKRGSVEVERVHRGRREERRVLVGAGRRVVGAAVPEAPGRAAHRLVALLTNHDTTYDLVPRQIHLLHPALDHIRQILDEMRTFLGFIDFICEIGLQDTGDNRLYLAGHKSL